MKKQILIICTFLFACLFVNGQKIFQSEPDVLLYLSTIRTFTNNENKITLTFTDMATMLSTGQSQFFQPEVILISTNRAIVTYECLTVPGTEASLIVDSKLNVVMDLKDKAKYRNPLFESANESSNEP